MIKYTQLSEKEREIIFLWLIKWLKQNEIASVLGRSPSTISREIKRNSSLINFRFNNNPKEKDKKENYYYLPDRAQMKYEKRKIQVWKQKPILKWLDIFLKVIEYIKLWYSPQIISWRLKKDKVWNISHEAIYQFIYSKEFRFMKLWEYLPQQHKKRRTKTWRKWKRNLIPNRIDISERPIEVEIREKVWHWEWDTIEWKRWSWASLHVSVERKTRLIRVRKITAKTAKNTNNAIEDIFKNIPKEFRLTTTFDNWSEFTSWEEISKKLGIDVYFTHPYASREKWTVERMNWFVRRFFPKWTDFNRVTKTEIKFVEDWINNRPMACLNFKSPNETYKFELDKLIVN